MRLRRIAFALPSRTKPQTERLEADDNALFIPVSASSPSRTLTRFADRTRFPFSHAKSSSSLTRLEIPGYVATRKKCAKRIPFFRSNTLSTLNLRTFSGLDLTSPECLIDETVRSLRTALMPAEDTKKQSPKPNRFCRQIQNLRGKFNPVGEENYLATETDSVRSFIASVRNPTREPGTFKESKTGKIMAALLIGSIQNMPLQNIGNDDPTSPVSSSNEQFNDEEESKLYCEEEEIPANPEETVSSDVKAEEQLCQDISSSIGETEVSSFDEDNSSPDDSSEDNTSYNILRDSRCTLDGSDFDKAEDSASSCERIEATRSSAESCTDSTLQVDSDATYRLSPNLNLGSVEGVGLRNDEIPIITVDIHESTDSDASVDASGLLPSDEDPSPDASTSPTDPNILISKIIHPSADESGDVDDGRQQLSNASARSSRRQSLRVEKDEQRCSATSSSDGSSHENLHRVHLTRYQRNLHRTHSLSVQRESSPLGERKNRVSKKRTDDSAAPNLSEETSETLPRGEMHAGTTTERQRCMLDLMKLIDTKMMVSRRDKKTVSLRSKRRKREKTIPASLERSASRGNTSTKRHREHHGGEHISLCLLPRVCSTPDCLSLDQHLTASSRPISRSCDSSLLSLSHRDRHPYQRHHRHHHHHHNHHHTRVSPSWKRPAVVAPLVVTHRRSDALEISRSFSRDIVALPHVKDDAHSKSTANTNQLAPRSAVAIRKCNSVCNLGETLCHVDRTEPTNTANITYNSCVSRPSPDLRQQDEAASSVSPSYPLPAVPSVATKVSQSPATRTLANVPLHRRSSDSDLSVTPKGWFSFSERQRYSSKLVL